MYWLELRAKIEIVGTFVGLVIAIIFLITGNDKK